MLSQFSSFRDSMIRQLNLFTDSVDLFFQRRQDRKLEPFFEEFDWLYELHLAGKLDDDYLELSLRKMTHSDQYHFLLALDEYVIIHSELLWLDIICSPHEKNGPKRMTKSLKTFLQICLATKKSFYINSSKECQKNQITTKMLEYFSPIFVLENDFKTFRNLVKNCINIYIEGRIKNGFFSLVFTNYKSRISSLKEERKIIDENDVTHPELAPVFHETLKTLKLLIKKKYNVNEENCEGELVLFDALDCNPVFVRILIEAGANFNAEDRNFDFFEEGNRNIFMPYRSSLREADIIENCAKNLVKLLNHKFTSTNSNYQIIPPFLSFSAKDKNTTMIKFLIVYGFHPLKQDKNGNTAFHLALKQDQIEIEIIKILLKNHYPIIPNNEGELPIDIARKKNLTEIIELFEAKSDFFREFSPTNLPTKTQEILLSKPKNKIASPNKSI